MKNIVRLTENQLKEAIGDAVRYVLSESVSDITYHFTSIASLLEILRSNEFYCTLTTNHSDALDKKRLFYFSTQRTKTNQVGYAANSGHSNVRIQLDGRLLSQKYSGRPVDYWGSMGKQSYYNGADSVAAQYGKIDPKQRNFEVEDRIFAYTPTIPDARKYITRVDILLKRNDENERSLASLAMRMLGGICYVYDNPRDFNAQSGNIVNSEIKDNYETATVPLDMHNMKGLRRTNRNGRTVLMLMKLYLSVACQDLDKNYKKCVRDILTRFRLEEYASYIFHNLWIGDVKSKLNLADDAKTLVNSIGYTPRKLNHEQGTEEAKNVMSFAAYVLNLYKASSFTEVAELLYNS